MFKINNYNNDNIGLNPRDTLYLNDYKSMSELRYSIDNYIVKYNSRRLHSAIGNKTSNEVYDDFINSVEFENEEFQLVA